MPGPPQARMTDMHICALTAGAPLPIMPPCALTVMVNKLCAARMSDLCAAALPIPPVPHPIIKGSMTVMIMKLPAARIGDPCSGGGMIVLGSFNVFTGG